MELSKQDYWSGLPFAPPGHLPDPRIKPTSLASPAVAGRFFTKKEKKSINIYIYIEEKEVKCELNPYLLCAECIDIVYL